MQSDPLGLSDGPNPYLYVQGQPISLSDPFGLASFIGFPPDKEAKMKTALEEAKKKLRECKNNPECFQDDGREKIIRNLDKARYVYKPNLPYCGEAGRFPFARSINIGPGAFNWAFCCDLSSTLAHEANHLGRIGSGGSESASRDLEKSCFNCPRPQR